MTVIATVLDVTTPTNTLVLTSVDASQNIVITGAGANTLDTGTIDGDVLSAALSAATLAPSGNESKFNAATTCTAEAGDDCMISSTSTTEQVLVTMADGANNYDRLINAEELRKAIANVLND